MDTNPVNPSNSVKFAKLCGECEEKIKRGIVGTRGFLTKNCHGCDKPEMYGGSASVMHYCKECAIDKNACIRCGKPHAQQSIDGYTSTLTANT